MLLWVDLETRGLVATKEKLLEVDAIMTDDALVEVARFHRVTDQARYTDFTKVDPYVLQMHKDNGLWGESLTAGIDGALHNVSNDLMKFIRDNCPEIEPQEGGAKKGPQLAGSTISFDRSFLQTHLPFAHGCLHYRNFDTTTLNELARRFWPKVHDARPRSGDKRHRAMADVEESLMVARYYASTFGAWHDVAMPLLSTMAQPLKFSAPGCGDA